ncbi:MAG: gliding motility-associated C-terminal domain-containing protein, partial [Cytophagales bacterium]|nr:gliding motility-associated C-terminal domain-containing protein [Cytophagales bacterium]
DEYEMMCDDTLNVNSANHPIANDIDSNQVLDLSGFTLITYPQHGNWTNQSNGKAVYQITTPNFEGTDWFTYRICDTENPVMCDTAKVLLQVKCHTIFFPNAFTPNGDGKNDVYEVFYVPFGVKVSIQFYNRWGDLVYFSEDYKNDWSGKSNAGVKIEDELASGTYFMVACASNGMKVSKYVVLIR